MPPILEWAFAIIAPLGLAWALVLWRREIRRVRQARAVVRLQEVQFKTWVLQRLGASPPGLSDEDMAAWARSRGLLIGRAVDFVDQLRRDGWAVVRADDLERLRASAAGRGMTVQEWLERDG